MTSGPLSGVSCCFPGPPPGSVPSPDKLPELLFLLGVHLLSGASFTWEAKPGVPPPAVSSWGPSPGAKELLVSPFPRWSAERRLSARAFRFTTGRWFPSRASVVEVTPGTHSVVSGSVSCSGGLLWGLLLTVLLGGGPLSGASVTGLAAAGRAG